MFYKLERNARVCLIVLSIYNNIRKFWIFSYYNILHHSNTNYCIIIIQTLEDKVRKLIENLNRQLKIWTGTYQILQLPSDKTGQDIDVNLGREKNWEVPRKVASSKVGTMFLFVLYSLTAKRNQLKAKAAVLLPLKSF